MTKPAEPDLPVDIHPALQDAIREHGEILRQGDYEPKLTAAVPTHTPTGDVAVEIVASASLGTVYLYVWNSTTGTWKGVQLTL